MAKQKVGSVEETPVLENPATKVAKAPVKEPRKKIPVVKNSLGLSDKLMPRKTAKALATYRILGVGDIDPLSGEEIIPPPVVIPATYTLFDKWEIDPNKAHKVMKRVTGVQHHLNPTTHKQEPIEILDDIYFTGGHLIVNIITQFAKYVFMELHPLNLSNPHRKDYPDVGEPVFERTDLDRKSIAEKMAEADLSVDAEQAVRKMQFETVKEHSTALGLSIMDKSADDIRFNLRIYARNHPRDFFSSHPNKQIQVRLKILDALSLGIIEYSSDGRKFRFCDEEVPFHTVMVQKDAESDLITHLCSKEGAEDLEVLEKLLNE